MEKSIVRWASGDSITTCCRNLQAVVVNNANSFLPGESVDYKAASSRGPAWSAPHRIVLRVAPDNGLERADVPNAPWG